MHLHAGVTPLVWVSPFPFRLQFCQRDVSTSAKVVKWRPDFRKSSQRVPPLPSIRFLQDFVSLPRLFLSFFPDWFLRFWCSVFKRACTFTLSLGLEHVVPYCGGVRTSFAPSRRSFIVASLLDEVLFSLSLSGRKVFADFWDDSIFLRTRP